MGTAFGREVDIQGGENNQLTQAVEAFFQGSKEGNTTSFRYIYPITSECTLITVLLITSIQVMYHMHWWSPSFALQCIK